MWSWLLIICLAMIPMMIMGVVPVDWATPIALVVVASSVLINAAPRSRSHGPFEMLAPVRGDWVALNSPGQTLPSHGTRGLGQYAAVDITWPSTPDTPPMVQNALRSSPAPEFPTFGADIYSMAPGTVVKTNSKCNDHAARNTWQSIAFMVTIEGFLRSILGVRALFGNHVIVRHDDGTFAAYAHLRQGSVVVRPGVRVEVGDKIAEVGNTGNSSVPHLHVQLMDRANPHAAAGLTMLWRDIELSGEIEDALKSLAKSPTGSAVRAMPRNGEIFRIDDP
ncbi:MAG TPA: peptidoglycan DD-metalloendopeptidase family protein [Candidatus Yaniella excrementigallinarum]|nr:peptidoglycan DD-metalloendopeptidase family protein [Candidatus Yaniella excrementigallinarum]